MKLQRNFLYNPKYQFYNSDYKASQKRQRDRTMRKSILIVIDSFGVGAMDDVPTVRPSDIGANTAWHLIDRESLYLPNLEKLGIMNAIGKETSIMKINPNAVYAKSKLKHVGADTYQGHQEIIGTKPKTPVLQSIGEAIDETEEDLKAQGYRTARFCMDGNQALIVNDCILIADNMETDLGQVINVSGSFKYTDFETVKKVGHIVRKHFHVSRIIALGGEDVELKQVLDSLFTKGKFIGLNTPQTGLYAKGYLVQHIGYAVDTTKQVPHALHLKGIPTYLYGKAADIINNEYGTNFYGVDTATLLEKLIEDLKISKQEEPNKDTFFMLNVQETDLAGHQCNPQEYARVLKITDEKIGKILNLLDKDDLLVVMADHGNDPYSGSNLHTRENVPVLIQNGGLKPGFYGLRETMADVGQTIAAYHGTEIENGTKIVSF